MKTILSEKIAKNRYRRVRLHLRKRELLRTKKFLGKLVAEYFFIRLFFREKQPRFSKKIPKIPFLGSCTFFRGDGVPDDKNEQNPFLWERGLGMFSH